MSTSVAFKKEVSDLQKELVVNCYHMYRMFTYNSEFIHL